MADRLTGNRLTPILTEFFAQGVSWEEVSRRLYADHGIQVSGQTLRRWAKELGLVEAVA